MTKVTVIDYGVGNLLSVTRAFEHLGVNVILTSDAKGISKADRLVLPGVGAFADGMSGLRERSLVDPIKSFGATGKPFLGICLGMQMMLDKSEEFGIHQGLGLISGTVESIPATSKDGFPHKIPYVGWNEIVIPNHGRSWDDTILKDVDQGEALYFVHSYTAIPTIADNRLADCFYNGRLLSAAIKKDNLYGCQFHPEKSGMIGLRIIDNFVQQNG